MGNWFVRWMGAAIVAGALAAAPATAQAPAPATISADDYVQLEVTLTLSGANGPMQFNLCPRQGLWDIDLRSLLGGADHITLGVTIVGPRIPQTALAPTVLTPVAIDRTRSGPLGLKRDCSISIDQIVYRSPPASVRRHDGESYAVSPTYVQTTAVNPGLISTVQSALSIAASLAKIPTETAAPFQAGIQNILGSITVGHRETIARHLAISEGPVPPASETTWVASGAIPAQGGSPARDLVLTARLIPITSLIVDPNTDANGAPIWTTTAVLGSHFAADLAPGVNPTGTLRGYVEAVAGTELNNFRAATTTETASAACDSLRDKVAHIGLSDRDTALVMWALTHDRRPLGTITAFGLDNLHCLAEAWENLPPIVKQTRTGNDVPPPALLAPPSTRQMQAATQIDDAFARFFVTSAWADRRRYAEALFAYPATYADAKALILPASTTLANPDQWLALHTAESPYVAKVGCYTYAPAAQADGRSLMYAIAELVGPGEPGRPAQVLLTATFANGAAQSDAKIAALTVSDSISDEQRALMRAANRGAQCASGFAPALLFSR